ncbi:MULTISPECIES: right-handed parallel beta-helix repeat-containing protein [unclassified Bradyrhizobium]|uniref:right-handed parallel beta-helix repeat-containing protein n=1 Tax=unclassified Bradyrhizobium TaxID=2631580 RepID=UPI001FF94CF0|nr:MULTISPECIES: right-handed parallel beta-helix repeat-containing protein [unclassified Bradyrhizobium]MCK1536879.1 right-handed parallel beta-helix repeat-containing protein [Bradyrhizobium sp. 176]MCK1560182.1 right-handed parallel beta-helix repeat-containing protein [Bradyrhizobium sp. 171]
MAQKNLNDGLSAEQLRAAAQANFVELYGLLNTAYGLSLAPLNLNAGLSPDRTLATARANFIQLYAALASQGVSSSPQYLNVGLSQRQLRAVAQADFTELYTLLGTAGIRFYVNGSTGSDSNPGTQAQPWQTVSKVNAFNFIMVASVLFAGGQTFTGSLTAKQGITYDSYGSGLATISVATNTSAIVSTNQSNVTIRNLNVSGGGGASGSGVRILNTSGNSSNVTVSNVTATGFAAQGIEANASSGQISNLNIANCTVSNCTTGVTGSGETAGIKLSGVYGAQVSTNYGIKNFTVSNCTVHDCPGVAGTTSWCGSGIFAGECDTGVITGCIAYNNGTLCNAASGPAGIWTADSKNVTIQYCTSHDNKTANSDGNGFDLDGGCDNCTIQYCYSYSNQGFGFMSWTYSDPTHITGNTNCVIRFNVGVGDTGGGIQLAAAGSTNTGGKVYGNTIANAVRCIEVEQSTTLAQIIANNIFQVTAPGGLLLDMWQPGAGLVLTGNDYYCSPNAFSIGWNLVVYNTFASWQTASGQEKISAVNVGLTANPSFVGSGGGALNYRVSVGSPVLGTGVNLSTQYGINPGALDYFGNAISAAGPYSVGAAWAGT